MGKRLLSAYELAQQRIIVSDYPERCEEADRREKMEQGEIDALPDFIDDWERPDKGDSPSSIMIDETENQSKSYTKQEIERYQSGKNQEPLNPLKPLKGEPSFVTKQQEKITINYNEKPMEVHWYGHFTSYSGFSRQNRAFAFGLSNRNVKVKLDIQRSSLEVNQATQDQLKFLEQIEISPTAPKVYGATVPLRLAHAGKKILHTMMETSKTLHEGYVGRINLYDEIWIPTHQGKELFEENGVRPPIRVMPLGVDTIRYNPNAKPMDFKFGLKDFVFVSVFKWGYRKGYDILLKAFMEEFSDKDDVSLLIVSRTDVNHKPEVIAEDFKNIRNGIAKESNKLPHVALYDKIIREKDMPGIYTAANAFVLISRGEGFGLPYYEAAAAGIPIIGSYCSGQTDLLTEEGAYLVEPDSYSKASINGNMSKLAKHCGFYEDQIFPDFGRPAIEMTKTHMRSVYEDYGSAEEKAAILGKYVRENCTWDMAIDRVYHRLKEIS